MALRVEPSSWPAGFEIEAGRELDSHALFYWMWGRTGYDPKIKPQHSENPQEFAAAERALTYLAAAYASDPNTYLVPDAAPSFAPAMRMDVNDWIASVAEAVQDRLNRAPSAKLTPLTAADQLLGAAASLEKVSIPDFQLIARLARYHAHKQSAAYFLELFHQTKDAAALERFEQEQNDAARFSTVAEHPTVEVTAAMRTAALATPARAIPPLPKAMARPQITDVPVHSAPSDQPLNITLQIAVAERRTTGPVVLSRGGSPRAGEGHRKGGGAVGDVHHRAGRSAAGRPGVFFRNPQSRKRRMVRAGSGTRDSVSRGEDRAQMKAVAVFPADRRFSVIEHPEPGPVAPTEIKLRILDVGICGTDKEIVSFQYGVPPEGSPYLVIGHESLGEVMEAGPEVTRVKPGDLAVPTVRRPCNVPTCIACRAGRQDFCYSAQYTERGIMRRHGFMTEVVMEEERYVNPVPRALREVAVLVEPLTIAEKAVEQLWQVQQRLPWTLPPEPGEPVARGRNALVLGGGPVGLLGAMKLLLEGFRTTVYSRTPASSDLDGLVTGMGAEFVHAETVSVAELAEQIGSIDVVYEAVGASSLAYDVMQYLGTNGVFIFTGVPGHKGPTSVDTDTLMRDAVLKNQMVFGTVNASVAHFAQAIADLGQFTERWPAAVRGLISHRFPIEQAGDALSGKMGGIKNVIAVGN